VFISSLRGLLQDRVQTSSHEDFPPLASCPGFSLTVGEAYASQIARFFDDIYIKMNVVFLQNI